MSNDKVADCSKYIFHLIHLTRAEKEWRGDHIGGVILVRGSFISAESSLLKGANKELRRCSEREGKWRESGAEEENHSGAGEAILNSLKTGGSYLEAIWIPSRLLEPLSGRSETFFQGALNGMQELSSSWPFSNVSFFFFSFLVAMVAY